MENCCRTFSKVVLIIFNILFLIIGILMFAFGIILKTNPSLILNIMNNFNQMDSNVLQMISMNISMDISIFMIVLGAVVMVISLVGIIGAATGKRALLIIYIIVLILVILAEIALIVFSALYSPKYFEKSFSFYDNDFVYQPTGSSDYELIPPKNNIGKFFIQIQTQFQCCGLNGPSDFENVQNKTIKINNQNGGNIKMAVLTSCCKNKKILPSFTSDLISWKECKNNNATYINQNGCLKSMFFGKIPIAIGGVTLAIQIILLIMAIIILAKKKSIYV